MSVFCVRATLCCSPYWFMTGCKQALALNTVICKTSFSVCLGMSAAFEDLLITDYTLFKGYFQVPGFDEGVAHLLLQPPISNCLNQITSNSFYNITAKTWQKIPPGWGLFGRASILLFVVVPSVRLLMSCCTQPGGPRDPSVGFLLCSWSSAMWKSFWVGDLGRQCPDVWHCETSLPACLEHQNELLVHFFPLWKLKGIR